MPSQGFQKAVLILSLLLPGESPAAARAQQPSDAKALVIAERAMSALGGEQNWARARYIHFTFVRDETRLTLTWDRWTGRYRLEGTTLEAEPYVVLMNLETREGTTYVDGREIEGEQSRELLETAYRVWSGETYWLLAPYKLRDPGVILSYEKDETLDGQTYAVLHLRFEKVGLTPGDEFWIYINRETYLMDKWRFVLESGFEGEFWWKDWRRFGGILLSTVRETPDGQVAIRMEDILVSDTLPDSVFTSPAPTSLP